MDKHTLLFWCEIFPYAVIHRSVDQLDIIAELVNIFCTKFTVKEASSHTCQEISNEELLGKQLPFNSYLTVYVIICFKLSLA